MSKDRAAPFSRKHRRYWIPITGGMIFIGILNVTIGYLSYAPPSNKTEKIELVLPPSPYDLPDGGIDAPATPADASPTN